MTENLSCKNLGLPSPVYKEKSKLNYVDFTKLAIYYKSMLNCEQKEVFNEIIDCYENKGINLILLQGAALKKFIYLCKWILISSLI